MAPTPATADTLSTTRPADFRLDLTLTQAPSEAGDDNAPQDPATTGRRFIVEADAVLHAAVGPGAASDLYPGATRQLTAAEFDALWDAVRADAIDAGATPRDPETTDAERTLALEISHQGRTTRLRTTPERAPRTLALLDRLAWLD